MRLAALGCALLLAGCTSIENVYILTANGDGCSATRGIERAAQGGGGGQANVLAQAGAASGTVSLASLLTSRVECKEP